MNHQLSDIRLRRGQLIERIASQRRAIALDFRPVQQPLQKADCWLGRVRSVGDYVKHHPGVVALGTVGLFLLKTERAWRWTKRGFFAWRTWRALRDSILASGARARSWTTTKKT